MEIPEEPEKQEGSQTDFMRECFRLAEKGTGSVSPNPRVGAVLVKDGKIVARGYHTKFGAAHAEVECLRSYKGDRSGTTLYVNLEPCSYQGKTPPCTDLILHEGVPRVVVAMKDPNPLVSGRGIRKLRRAGVEVSVGLLEREARELNRFFVKHVTTGRPYVHLKVAQSIDGKIADRRRDSRWLSSLPSRSLVHRWRASHDAILVGAGTIEADNPALTVRLVKGRNPDVVILDGWFRVGSGRKVFSSARGRRIFVCVRKEALHKEARKVAALVKQGVTVVGFPAKRGVISLQRILRFLSSRGIGSVLVEGGGVVFGEFVRQGLVDEVSLFVVPRIIGVGTDAFAMSQQKSRRGIHMTGFTASPVGPDILLKGFIE